MLGEGVEAPAISLPAYVDGERREVDLGETLGSEIVVLVFYPADFNPACTPQDADIGDLDLFTMQKDVSVFGVSPDSTYSHEAFADRYGLHVPLLSDTDGRAAERYGVELTAGGESLCQRAVFVVDHRGVIQYAWATDDLAERPDVDPIKRAVSGIGGDDTALARFREGYSHYVDGRDAFETAMAAYEDREWPAARAAFRDAETAFGAAADRLDTATRFAETPDFETVIDRSQEKADTLGRAAEWLADSADAFVTGSGASATQYREDAQGPLDAATDLPDPPTPDRMALEDGGVVLDDDVVVDHEERDRSETALAIDDADLDAAARAAASDDANGAEEAEVTAVDGDLELDPAAERDDDGDDSQDGGSDIEGDTVEGDLEVDLDAVEEEEPQYPESETQADASGEIDGDESTAETPLYRGDDASPADGDGAAEADTPGSAPDSAGTGGASSGGAAPSATDAETETETEEPAELDLADPTDDEADEEDDDERDWDIPGQ